MTRGLFVVLGRERHYRSHRAGPVRSRRARSPDRRPRGRSGTAFGHLVEPYRRELHAHCYRILGSLHDAEDALQDALLRAWRGLPGFDGRSSLRSWLHRIATNTSLDAAVAWERRAAEPMLPMRLFRRRGFSAGNAAVFCLFGSMFGGVFFVAQFMQVGLGDDVLEAGLHLLPWTANLFLVAPVAGALADRVGDSPLLVGGMALQAIGMAWVALIAEPGMAYGELVVPLIVAGLGGSMAIPPAAGAVVRAVPAEAVGTAAGANGMLRELGGVFGIAASVAVFAGAGGYASAAAFTDGFVPAIGLAAGLASVGALVSLALPGRRSAACSTQWNPAITRRSEG